jgi:hypothetical protein
MYKKEVDRPSYKGYNQKGTFSNVPGKKAQVTLFIIVGMLVFFAFMFVILMTRDVQNEQLDSAYESVVSRTFGKEGLRIYVQDCLEDGLVDGLKLLGRQGGIWSHQGGTISFKEGESGVEYAGEKVFYGISYQENENYPKENYVFPQKTTFGKNNVKLSFFEKDLSGYLEQETIKCMENFTKSNFSKSAELVREKADIDLRMVDDGVSVKVEYPLRILVGGQEYFQLSEFDFFYSTKIKQFFDVALFQPVAWDVKHADFDFKDFTGGEFQFMSLTNLGNCDEEGKLYSCPQPTFHEKWDSFNFIPDPIDYNDDTIFEFKPDLGEIEFQDYTLRIARQNRPPALDYINRCPVNDADIPDDNYDYLVIPNQEGLKDIDINLKAIDPDENKQITYLLDSERTDQNYRSESPVEETNLLFKATDGVLEDSQLVKIKVGKSEDSVCCAIKEDGTFGSPGANEVCSQGELGCYGGSDISKKGFILESRTGRCDSINNKCNDFNHGDSYILHNEIATCGDSNLYDTCEESIPNKCRGKPAWSIQEKAWCYGDNLAPSGCETICESEIVGSLGLRFDDRDKLNNGYTCGCNQDNVGKNCLKLENDVIGECVEEDNPIILNPNKIYLCK